MRTLSRNPVVLMINKCMFYNSSFHLVVIWVLFENVMSFHRLKAAITGLLEARRVNEWIVTEKLGDAHRAKPANEQVVDIEKLEDTQVTKPLLEAPKNKRPISRFWQRYAPISISFMFMP